MNRLSVYGLLAAVTLLQGCHRLNRLPGPVAVPLGPSSVAVGIEYSFSSCARDSYGDDVQMRFDWGDGDTSGWSPWVHPDDIVAMSHSWTAPGTFGVRAQARARSSAISDWSGALAVGIYHEWVRVYGGGFKDDGWSVQVTRDGGYIVTGSTKSWGAGASDVWLLKIGADGETAWTRTFGGAHYDWGKSVQQTRDGGFIISGGTCSFSGNESDILIVETDAAGNEKWEKVFGKPGYDRSYSVQQTADGGYAVAGYSQYGAGGAWLLKTNGGGDTTWTRIFGHGWSECRSVRQTRDGGYIIAALPDFEAGHSIWLIKTDAGGDTIWTRSYGDVHNYYSGMWAEPTQDRGYIVVGTTCSVAGGPGDVLLVKTDSQGTRSWARTFGGEYDDWGNAVHQTRDGGYVVVGNTSFQGAVGYDIWLIKTDANGDTVWTRTFGLNSDEMGYSVQQTQDGGYIITGSTESEGEDFTDLLLIKTDPEGKVDRGGQEP